MKAINLTFKNNKEELKLYEWICKRSNKSGFIKDILQREKEKEENLNSRKLQGFLTLQE
jgi:hypothetical protein